MQGTAYRLVGYWKFRRELFGDKAFLPMTQDGALADDMDALTANVMLILPNDIHGRAVVFFDRAAMKPHIASRESFVSNKNCASIAYSRAVPRCARCSL